MSIPVVVVGASGVAGLLVALVTDDTTAGLDTADTVVVGVATVGVLVAVVVCVVVVVVPLPLLCELLNSPLLSEDE